MCIYNVIDRTTCTFAKRLVGQFSRLVEHVPISRGAENTVLQTEGFYIHRALWPKIVNEGDVVMVHYSKTIV